MSRDTFELDESNRTIDVQEDAVGQWVATSSFRGIRYEAVAESREEATDQLISALKSAASAC